MISHGVEWMLTSHIRRSLAYGALLTIVWGCLASSLLAQGAAEPAPLPPGLPSLSEENPIPTKNLLQVFHDGGLLMYPIALCSFILLVFVFERAISLRRGRVIPRPFVKRFIEQVKDGRIDQDQALALCEENQSPVAEVFAAAVKKWGRSCVEVEQAILDAGERVTSRLRQYLRLFNGISTISPLLGLLGTVLGMISAFNAIAANGEAAGQREVLASGISQALLTTAAGMSVALPALIAYLFFSGRVDRLIMEIDLHSQEVVNAIASDGWKDKRKSTSRRASRSTAKAA
ncbi:MotA/TolQ/ExbB proton channel family protein [Bremerella sp. P1]|uniref:MotA/TolQ/ExbB proton channel family protein n=1 Tax=Bremerella sp. P1 TaxID=3026424 RepID=UPI00236834CC|nr:MotA/TolQ/ExbB proton channel family protein [Bremerella sp. P1]WDI42318.1 MotA/TolQ/ExbB proton channel family protein [Bremerella sp. P1]